MTSACPAGVSYSALAGSEPIARCAPISGAGPVPELFEREAALYTHSPQGGLFTVSGGTVDSQGLCNSRWGSRVDWNARALPAGRTTPGASWRPDRLLRRAVDRGDSVLSLAHPEQRGYFHWLFDVLPRYAMMRGSGAAFDAVYLDQSLPFQRETWRMLGDRHAMIDAGQVPRLRARALLVPSAASVSGVVPTWVCSWLRAAFIDPSAGAARAARRLYISRESAARGRVANETALRSVLAAHGFEIVHAEGLSATEQVELFGQAELIVGPHGAGLSNLVFAPPTCTLVELFARSHLNVCYWTLAGQLGIRYAFLVCPEAVHRAWTGRPDMVVDPDALDRLLVRLRGS